jgi:hypothetical protein
MTFELLNIYMDDQALLKSGCPYTGAVVPHVLTAAALLFLLNDFIQIRS